MNKICKCGAVLVTGWFNVKTMAPGALVVRCICSKCLGITEILYTVTGASEKYDPCPGEAEKIQRGKP